MPFLSDSGEVYPTWNGKAKVINYETPSMRRPIGAQDFRWHPGPLKSPPVKSQTPLVGWGNRFATRPMHTAVPQRYLNLVRPVLEEGRPVNRSVTGRLPEDWRRMDEATSIEERPSTIKTIDGIGGTMPFLQSGHLGASDWVDMIGQRPEDYYDPETDIMGMDDLAFFKKLRKRVSKVFKPITKAKNKLVKKIRKPIVKFATKNMRGQRGRRLALVLGGPAGLLLRKQIYNTVFSKKGLIHGRLPIPKKAIKIAKKIPVLRKMPGLNRGYITPAMLRSKHMLIPGYAVAQELKKKKRRRPAQVAAEASVQAAKSIANQQGQDFTQIMEQPQFQDLIEQRAIEMIKAQERDLMSQMTEAKKEQMIREAEINQWRVPSPPPPPVRGARDRESMLAQNQWAALNTMERMNIPPTPTNVRMVSKKVADRFAFNQAGELEAAKEEEKYLRDELQAVQQAKRGVTTGMKVGGEWWGDEGFSPF